MANAINWVQTQNQGKLNEIAECFDGKVTPKTSQSEVENKLEKAHWKNNVKELVFWLAYAKLYGFHIKGRRLFKKIKELWPSVESQNPELANAFHFLNTIYSENYTERNNSAQMYNYAALLAEFSQV